MGWGRLDDGFFHHPKFVSLRLELVGLWAKGLGYCNAHLTDGFIHRSALPVLTGLPPARAAKLAGELVTARLWDKAGDGYQVHDFLDWNESAQDRRTRLAQSKERKERHRERVTGRFGNASQNASGAHPGTRSGTRDETRSVRPPKPSQALPPTTPLPPSSVTKATAWGDGDPMTTPNRHGEYPVEVRINAWRQPMRVNRYGDDIDAEDHIPQHGALKRPKQP